MKDPNPPFPPPGREGAPVGSKPPAPRERLAMDRRDLGVIFVHSELDDAGLAPQDFRIYAHLARRANGSQAWPSVATMTKVCRIARNRVREGIATLTRLGLLKVVHRKQGDGSNATNLYVLTRKTEWKLTLT
ncbi:MAG: helix-turn-helix domain-containing protein, partial [Verrucomicrobiia bacterium]